MRTAERCNHSVQRTFVVFFGGGGGGKKNFFFFFPLFGGGGFGFTLKIGEFPLKICLSPG